MFVRSKRQWADRREARGAPWNLSCRRKYVQDNGLALLRVTQLVRKVVKYLIKIKLGLWRITEPIRHGNDP